MRTLAALATIIIAIAIVLGASGLLLNLQGIVPKPEQYAAATATVQRAIDESERYKKETQATVTYLNERMKALPTQIPSEIESQNRTAQAISWFVTGGVGVVLLIGLAIAMFVYIRGQFVPRGKDGQMPVRAIGNATVDMHRAVGPAVAVQQPGVADRFWHIVRHTPLPESKIVTSDKNADASQLLAAVQSANAVSATAAMFQPGVSNVDRKSRVELTRKEGMADPWGRQLSPPSVRIVANGDDAIEIIARHIGDALPPAQPARMIESPAPLDGEEVLTESMPVQDDQGHLGEAVQ